MDKGPAVVLMAAVGGLIALQAPVNAGLGRATGDVAAALINFIVGGALLAAILVISGKAGGVSETANVDWYYLLGGVFGAAYVFTALFLVSEIGAGGVAAATITGQLVLSVVLDRLGVLGLEQTSLSAGRLLGVAMLLAGTYLIVR
jgi:bacterial/archaeal transporter family-2 protein